MKNPAAPGHGNISFKLYFWMISAMILWGFSWVNGKVIAAYAPPAILMFWRFLLAAFTIAPLAVKAKSGLKIPQSALKYLFSCAIMLVLYNYFFFVGTKTGLSGAGGVFVTTTNPIFTYIIAIFLSARIPSLKNAAGIVLGIAGGCILLEIWTLDRADLLKGGNLMFLYCSLSWTVLTLFSPRILAHVHTYVYSFWVFLLSAIISLISAWNMDILVVFQFDRVFWLNLFAVSIGSLTVATSIYFYATSRLGPSTAASFIFVVPVIAMSFSMIVFNEPLHWNVLFGGISLISAVYLLNSKPDRDDSGM